jgi:iron(III) transport system substrate-binding protein
MPRRTFTRRSILAGAAAAGAQFPLATRVLSQAPPAEQITPALVEAAKKEGKVNFYTAMEINVAEQFSKLFEAKFPGIKVRVERSGAERVFTRIAQEYASKIYNVDFVNTTDAAHVYVWKHNGWLQPYVPADVAEHFPAAYKDKDGQFMTARILFVAMAYNTKLVKPEDAPKGFEDLLDPKWAGKIVKAHPSYSGAIMTSTYAISRDLGWRYFEQLAKQRVMQVQSGVDPPKKVALGERAVMADGADYIALQLKAKGEPIELIMPSEGAPIVNSPNALFKQAANPNAARLFYNWFTTAEGQEKLVQVTGQYVPHSKIAPAPGRPPLSDIKIMKDDPEAVLKMADEIKSKYTAIFKV